MITGQTKIARLPKFVPDEIVFKSSGRRGGAEKYADYDDEIQYITKVVGSKNKKDITRKNAFMSKKAFEAWNQKRGGNYAMHDEDIDDDEIKELVVRNPKGELVAVNGYTVKRSDWGVRKPFYETYPTREERRGKSLGEYVRDTIYETTANDFDDYGYAKEGYIKRIKNIQSQPEYAGYSMKASTPSPYNLFIKNIIKPAVDYVLSDIADGDRGKIKTLRILCDLDYGKGWMMQFAGKLWNDWVRNPIIKSLRNQIELYKNKYNENHVEKISDVEDEKFVKWLLNRAEIKAQVKKAFEHIMKNKQTAIKTAMEFYEPFLKESAEKSESFEHSEIQPEEIDDSQLSI